MATRTTRIDAPDDTGDVGAVGMALVSSAGGAAEPFASS